MQKVDKQIRKIIDEQYALARKLIEDNQDKMHAMAKALLEWETIDAEQIEEIMAGQVSRVLPRTGRPRSTALAAVTRSHRSSQTAHRLQSDLRTRHTSINGASAPLCIPAYLSAPCSPGTPPVFRST
jgi:hypothetical protein